MKNNITIKTMETEEEIGGKAYVHWKSWQETYADLMDASFLSAMTLEKCLAISKRFCDNVLIAKDGERVIGFCAYGKSLCDDIENCGEIFGLYLLEEYHKQGIGFALMNRAAEKLSSFSKISLWVLRGNTRAIPFYERYGFSFDGVQKDIMTGTPNVELRMIWER